VQGTDVGRIRNGRRLRRRVGVVFQDYRLLDRLSAVENVAYALRVADLRLPRREAGRQAATLLEEVGLGDRLKAYPRQLSGGQQQRVAIARALGPAPALLLADEPTANLDEENATHVLRLLQRAARHGTAVLVATHDAGQVAAFGGRILALERGRLQPRARPRVLGAAT
jgi:cell division transport system ATP-binding protein